MLITDASAAANRRAQRVMPMGNTRSSAFATPYPIYLASGEGAYVTDVDGNRYLDFQNNFTALIHGYGHADVTSALLAQLMKGLSFANPTFPEIELAELLCDRVAHFEQVRFTNTGSEAVMMAIKAARALTGRTLVAKCEGAYHGNYDAVEINVSAPPTRWTDGCGGCSLEHDGLTASVAQQTVAIPFNDIKNSDRILSDAGCDLAAVLIDPLPSRAGLVQITPEYLAYLRRWTSARSALLISDEVLSFRLGYTGAFGESSIKPDITAFGKIIGGGLPIGAVAGGSDVMKVFAPLGKRPHVAHSGTFTANPMTMVAGLAAMAAMTKDEFHRINQLGDDARRVLADAFRSAGVTGAVTGTGSLFRIFIGAGKISSYADAYLASRHSATLGDVIRHMRDRGVLISQVGLGAISTPMTPTDIGMLAAVFEDALRAAARRSHARKEGAADEP
ncbi:aspartate aminotransferase family protein [Neorhizobium galegae]|uniref:aspartate aminotransferase family protein n=1 Tax=Neorhizobium galegae TaxID=399 RepID=UPI00062149EA|nr:aminotransferase class III-fold pyridoxal phosphate-dependent enzyme [Neorhizobium galegae]CDZ56651.1 Glutamate-1-semialdehyde 2,1-aminomutase 2 [Neorhizobium galegae bv. orientalis]KAB1122726.1 aminotransferase class III-fold pyridoxal phosphate-dependent enzyme [Neorhizobium galegae]MCQ1570325.1 aminotransferase class III-fold pyridoxal phosphate-dependent enzyme [Neorhizobium galegae]MCQ1807834.1 aminotransferase class III-fold pyridoxal phosphate-dependent enzyme [Neorhizobium galegae]M